MNRSANEELISDAILRGQIRPVAQLRISLRGLSLCVWWDMAVSDRSNDKTPGRYSWSDGHPLYSGFNTTLPPNSEVCLGAAHSSGGHAPASSRHPGGVHVLMSDGAVKFVSDSVEAGDGSAPVVTSANPGRPSPYGLWGALGRGALGTRTSHEVVGEEL